MEEKGGGERGNWGVWKSWEGRGNWVGKGEGKIGVVGKVGGFSWDPILEVGELIVPQEGGALSNGVSLLEGTDGRGPGNGWRGDGRGRAAPGV